MKIAHNLAAMNVQRQLNIVTDAKQKSTEKLSSGYRINRAADDAAGLSISEKMRNMIRGLNRGTENTQDGVSWVQVADGAMTEIHDMLDRMMELSVQAANGTNSDSDRAAINAEYEQLMKEIDMINYHTEFNEKRVFLDGRVQLAVSGDPGDLEVFDATYDSKNQLVSYGGFKFHGERIRWDKVDPKMVSTVNGKQVFNKGVYKFENSAVDSAYYFEVATDKTTEVPYITRNIDVKADYTGIKIDGYQIPWEDIGINKSSSISGNFKAHYGDAVLEIIVESSQDLDDIIESINSKSDGVFEYQWITSCVGVQSEKAVDMFNTYPGGNYSSVEIVDNNMAKDTKCNATQGSDPVSKLEYTIVVAKNGSNDPSKQTIYLEGSVGGKIPGSEKTLASLGITSWDFGTSIKEGKEYIYKDTSGTGVEFKFTLSDITSFDSFEDGLYKVKLSGSYSTSYDNKVKSSDADVVIKGQSGFYNVTTFDQEIQLGRDFDSKSYEVQSASFSYDADKKVLQFNVESVIPGKADLYSASLSTAAAQSRIESDITIDTTALYRWKLQQALNNESTHKTYGSQKTDFTVGDSKNWIRYEYDTSEYLNSLDKALNVEMVESSDTTKDVPNDKLNDYYVQDDTGKYVDARKYMEDCVDKAISIIVGTGGWEDGKYQLGALGLSAMMNWNNGAMNISNIKLVDGDDYFNYVNNMVLQVEKNDFNSEEELFNALKNQFVPGGDYSHFRLSDNVKLYQVKVSFDESEVAFGKGTINAEASYIAGRKETYPPEKSNIKNINSLINESIENYSGYVMGKIKDASAYSVYKDEKDTKATFSGDENQNLAVRALYDSEMLKKPIERGIRIQHSGIRDDYTIIPQFAINASILGLRSVSIDSEFNATRAIDKVGSAIAYVSGRRGTLGAVQNRLEHTLNNNRNKAENLTAAESRIRDTNMAKEVMNNTKLGILEQAINSMLAQANQSTQGVIGLLQ